jgi:transposase
MISDEDSQVPIWSYRVNLDKRVRSDHPLRRIRSALDLSFVRKAVAHTYGKKGNKSVPPEVIIRMMLLLFLDDIKSERELMRIIPERLDYLWFLGYGLDDQIPDHSVLSKARKRWGKEVFVSLFSQVVQQCVAAGLVEGSKIHVDASLVAANASLGSVRPLDLDVVKAIEQAAKEQVQKLDEQDDDEDPPSEGGDSTGASIGPYAKTNRQFRSRTDPDATLVRQGGLKSALRYKTHRVVDDAHEIITAVETTTGAVDEASQLLGLIEAHEDITEQGVRTVIADARYGSISNLIGCQKAKIRAHVKLLGEANRGKGRSEGIYSEEHFSYDPLTNTYRCPANEIMKPRRLHPQRQTWEYVTAKGTCLVCKLRALCTRSRTGRTIHRHRDQASLDKARQIANSKAAKADLKRRQHLMERSFADAANCHGLKRARWRGLWKQAIQDLLIATVQNLRKLIRYLSQSDQALASCFLKLCYWLISLLCERCIQTLANSAPFISLCCQLTTTVPLDTYRATAR